MEKSDDEKQESLGCSINIGSSVDRLRQPEQPDQRSHVGSANHHCDSTHPDSNSDQRANAADDRREKAVRATMFKKR